MESQWREVLIVTGGSTPQVVTETIYALGKRSPEPIIPAKIICVVTKGVADRFGDRFEAALERLKAELRATADWDRRLQAWRSGQTGLFVEFPRQQSGSPVNDIRSNDDAVLFGDLVSEIVRYETSDEKARVHLSLAGGRKTMSFHGGAALSLFGRPQDELSHVLVPQDYEGCEDFWFKTAAKTAVRHRDGRELDASDAEIELADIPFIRVRDRLPDRLLTCAMDYNAYVAQTNAVLGRVPLFLELTTAERCVRIGKILDFSLPPVMFALYQLMAEWKRDDHAGAGPDGIGPAHRGWLTAAMFEYPERYRPNPVERFIEIHEDTFKTGVERSGNLKLELYTTSPQNEKLRKFQVARFATYKSHLVDELQERLHHRQLADRFGAPLSEVRIAQKITVKGSPKTVHRVVFGLPLLSAEIIINAG